MNTKPNLTFRILLVTNILTITILCIVLIKEKYPSRMYGCYFRKKATIYNNHLNNIAFHNQTAVYPLYQGQKNIVMLGNSRSRYPNWNELLGRDDIACRGIDGDLTQGFLERLNYVINLSPKICFIEIGIDDLDANIDEDRIIKNLMAITDQLQNHSIKSVLTTITLVAEHAHVEDARELNKKIILLNKKIVQVASAKNLSLIDLNPYVSSDNYLHTRYASQDGIHYRGEVYLFWKTEIEKLLKKEKLSIHATVLKRANFTHKRI